MKVDVKFKGGGVILVDNINPKTMADGLMLVLDHLAKVELFCLKDSIDSHGNIVGGLICVRNAQMFPLDDNLIAEAIPPIRFELTRHLDEVPDFYYPIKKDNKERNKSWKESLRRAEQKSVKRGKGR